MKFFNQLLQAIFLLMVGVNTLLYATCPTIRIISDDKTNPAIENQLGETEIIGLSAHFENITVTVNNYIIKSLPDASLGILYMPDGTTPVFVGQHLIQADADALLFDPVKSCTASNATFTYVGISDTGVEGTFGTITIPLTVSAECTTIKSEDRENPTDIINSSGATDIINLSGDDANGGAVNSFIITSLPSADEGILYMADGTTAIRVGQLLTSTQADGLKFEPNNSFEGRTTFSYVAVDDNNIKGNEAVVTLQVVSPPSTSPAVGKKPTADDKENPKMLNSLGAVNIFDLSGKDANGDAVDSFIITSLPSENQGILYMNDGKTAVKLNQILTQEEANGLKFDPNANFIGDVTFNYVALDGSGSRSNPATVTIPLIAPTGTSAKPIADDKENPEMLNTLGSVNILDLSGKDGHGNVVNHFIITSLPSENQGILYMSDGTTPITVNQHLTQEEADGLKFDPNNSFVGNAIFTYQAIDDNGLKSLDATVTLPIIKPLEPNAPTADDKKNPEMLNTLGAVNILDLSGKDSSGNAVNSFIITSLPTSNQGVLYMEDGKTAVKLNQILTQEEANGLKFDPSINFIGNVTFTYMAIDSSGLKSANATVTIPLISSHNSSIVTQNDEGYATGNANSISINVLANDRGGVEGATVHLVDNSGNMVEELSIEDEGIWSVDENNNIIFTPVAPFVGTPTPVSYLVQDANGAISNTATVNISGQCICKAYKEDIPVFSTLGLLFIFIFSSILGSLLIQKEVYPNLGKIMNKKNSLQYRTKE